MEFSQNLPKTKCLSIFYSCPIPFEARLVFPIQRFLWFKSENSFYRELLLDAQDSKQAAFYGSISGFSFLNSKHRKELKSPIEEVADWSIIAYKIMLATTKLKLKHNPLILEFLLKTKDEPLIEIDHPSYWGTTDTKKNRYGKLLMKLRTEFGRS